MDNRMKSFDRAKEFLLPRLRRGELNLTQAAWVSGATKQAVWYWCLDAGIRIKEAEHRRLVKLRSEMHRWVAGEPLPQDRPKRVTKASLRAEADAAKQGWDRINGRDSEA
jgi:hypothetical protein